MSVPTSTIKLYSGANWELLPEKLLIVEDIATYLSSKTATTISNFQYIRNKLELSIKVDVSQDKAQPKDNGYRYVSITDTEHLTNNIYYYFVKHIEQLAPHTIRLDLVMDVLNTFKESTHYVFKPSTKIIREHKNRMKLYDLKLVLTIPSYSVTGDVDVDDIVTLKYLMLDRVVTIGTGEIVYFDDGEMKILFENLDLHQAKADIQQALALGIVMTLTKDISNYMDIEFTTFEFTYDIVRDIDYVPENINPTLYKVQERLIQNKTPFDVDWFLLYRNQNTPDDKATSNTLVNPVECYLIPSSEIGVLSADIVAGRLNATSLNMSYYYYSQLTAYGARPAQTMTLDNGVVLTPNANSAIKTFVVLKRNSDNTISVEAFEGQSGYTKVLGVWTCKYVTLNNLPFYYKPFNSYIQDDAYDITQTYVSAPAEETWTDSITPFVLDSVDKIDRTDAKNIKLIKLPYCPYNFTLSGSKIDVTGDSNWDYIALTQGIAPDDTIIYALKLNDLNVKLQGSFTDSNISIFNIFKVGDSNSNEATLTALRKESSILNGTIESKLLNSEFCSPRLVYDSFYMGIDLEKLDASHYYVSTNRTFKLIFTMTRTINSKFMFQVDKLSYRLPDQNYPNVLAVARNNEMSLYNVPYINYIRTGFNYDVKSKNMSIASNWAGVGLSALSTATSLLLPSVPLKIAGVVGSLVSMAISIKGAVIGTMQNEESFKQKQLQMQNQTASVSGSDDVDLMSEYAENRLKFAIFWPNELMFHLLDDLFFYAGYNSGRIGLPNHNNRINFDYLECDAQIQKTNAMPDECVKELINCFKTGVTYLHRTSRSGTNAWDWEQKYENWEKEIMEEY